MKNYITLRMMLTIVTTGVLTGCGGGTSFSLLSSSESFQQLSSTVNTKVDVLWVIDNSGSMASSQNNLATNFPSFINTFTAKGYDYQIAVTASDAYLALPAWTPYFNQVPRPSYYEGVAQDLKAKFRDGVGATHSGVFIINPLTAALNSVFVTNVKQGTSGHGDERVIHSAEAALTSVHNVGFVRPGGFLAVIMVTDEDDFSHANPGYLENQYNNPALFTTAQSVAFYDALTGSSGATRKYSVSALSIHDEACRTQLFNGAQKISVRVDALADATNGKKASLCANFATELSDLANEIVRLSTQFFLKLKPIVSTIQVTVAGNVVPRSTMENPADPTGPRIDDPAHDGGWDHDANANSIVFSGAYIPPQGASLNVSFDPDGLQF